MWNEEKRIIESQLSGGEHILWTGRPRQGFFFRKSDALMIPFSLMWGGFAIFWETSVWVGDTPSFFKLWGIPFVLVGLYLIFGRFIYDILARRKTFYGVTNERIIILSGLFNQTTKSLNIKTLTDVTMEEMANGFGTIFFGTPNPVYSNNIFRNNIQQNVPMFEQIINTRSVYEMIRNAQKQTA